jgi:endonuclease-3 related protein
LVSDSYKIAALLQGLAEQYGSLFWWRGTTDEVMIGAILTQQTRWEAVEMALDRLRNARISTIEALYRVPANEIEGPIRCTGFFRVKARRLKALAVYVIETWGGVEQMRAIPTEDLRRGLLTVKGIGDETADSILCYGFGRRTFVIDAYTERICRCAGIDERRRALKARFEAVVPQALESYVQGHAHIVEFAKDFCGRKRCNECWIRSLNG